MTQTIATLSKNLENSQHKMNRNIDYFQKKMELFRIETNKKIEEVKNSVKIVKINRKNEILEDNINIHEIVKTNKFKLGVSNNTFAVIIQIYFVYNGTVNKHGYLEGNFIQSGSEKTPEKTVNFKHHHFNLYYNTETVDYMVPWDATLGKFLEMNITSSYNTDAKNIYKVSFVGEFTN